MGSRLYRRKDRLIREKYHHVYPAPGKWPQPTRCPRCGAVFAKGRWMWEQVSEQAHETLYPACRRIEDKFPAGWVEISGSFLRGHQEEIRNMIRNVAKEEQQTHPLERIMGIVEKDDHILITTTGVHIARRIGDALSRAYKGDLAFRYGEAEKSIRVGWRRDA